MNPPAPVGIGETVDIIDNGAKLGTLTINSVSLTSDRNRFSDDDPAQVVIINYTYENTDSSEDLLYFSSNFKLLMPEAMYVIHILPTLENPQRKRLRGPRGYSRGGLWPCRRERRGDHIF